ncbi:MAG: hypothetical protein IT555_14590 [Acetobacteraceae bacterium]|nr:hypothetical protein [Acetobacteraceae bacterium]
MNQVFHSPLHRQAASARPAAAGLHRPAAGSAPAARKPLPLRPARTVAPIEGTVAFADAAQAWFWTLASLTARRDGTSSGGRGIPRPCDPDDVILALDLLYRRGGITLSHARVLRRWGDRGRAPEPGRPTEAADAQLWTEALDRLDGLLRVKRIVA